MLKCCVLPLSSACLQPYMKCFGKSEILKIALEYLQFFRKSNSLLPHTRNCPLRTARFLISTISYRTFISNHFSFFTAFAREKTNAEKPVLSGGTCKANNTKLRFHICDAALNINGNCSWQGMLDHIKKIK